MLRQTSINKVFAKITEAEISPILTQNSFKYSKTNNYFNKTVNGFDVIITPRTSFPTITYIEENDKLFFNITLDISIKCLKFEKWHEVNFEKKAYFEKKIENIKCQTEIDLDIFSDSDFYSPTPSQQFKNSIKISLSDKNDDYSKENLTIFLNNNFFQLLDKAENYCNDIDLFNDSTESIELIYANLLIFLKKNDKAATVYMETYYKLIGMLEKFRIETDFDNSYYIFLIKRLAKYAKKFLNLDFEIPNYLPLLSSFKELKIEFPNTNIKYKEVFSIIKHSKTIVSFCVSTDGRVIVGHENMNIHEKFITIWGKNGNLLLEKELPIKEGTSGGGKIYVGYIEELNLFFANHYIINEDLEMFDLEFPIVSTNKSNLSNNYSIPLTYDHKAQLFIAYYRYKTDKENFILFYDKNYKIVKKLVVKLRPLDIIVEKQWILLYNYTKHITIIDYEGNEIAKLDSNNATDVNGIWGQNKYHAISKSNKYLFSFFYYVKSNIFDLDTFKKDVLWAHPTYEKNYKELYYNDVNQNFGLHPAKFSPNDKYIVGGADHGKYVAWTLPEKKRIELIPNEEYLVKMLDSGIFYIGGKKYLKNRANEVQEIEFWENGKYFSFVINNDLLIWNDNFEHISTIFNIRKSGYDKILNFHDKYIGLYNKEENGRGELIIFQKV